MRILAKIGLVFLLCSAALGQTPSFVSFPILTPNGVAIAGANVALCTALPTLATPCGGTSLRQTYTDISLITPCTLNASTLGPTYGTGCTNPGLADGFGVVRLYANIAGTTPVGFLYYQAYNQGIVTPDIEPIMFPGGGGGGGGSVLPNGAVTFTNSISVSLPTTYASPNLLWSCWDNNSPANAIFPATTTLDLTSYTETFTFFVAQSGFCVTNGNGGGTAGGVRPVYGDYTLAVSSGSITATNATTGLVDYSGPDLAPIVNAILNASVGVGVDAHLFFKKGIYTINSLTQENASGWTNYYCGICIPPNDVGFWTQVHIDGEERTSWNIDSANRTTIQEDGVIFDVSSTAVSSVSSSAEIVPLWQRPEPLNPPNDFSNEVFLKNIQTRLPSNTRGCELGIGLYTAWSIDLENVSASFNMTPAALSTNLPTAGSCGSYGIGSSYGSSGNVQHFKNVYTAGFQYGYDIQGEHWVADTVTSVYSTYAGIIGRSGTAIYHPIVMTHVVDQENQNGWVFGTELQLGQHTDIFDLDIETLGSGAFTRVNNLYETTSGNTNGVLTYVSVESGVGEVPISPFSHGGVNFLVATGNGWQTAGLPYGPHILSAYGSCGTLQEGRHAIVCDASSNTWGATITGSGTCGSGGTFYVEAYCDHAGNWTVEAK